MKIKFTWGHGVIVALLCFIGYILFLMSQIIISDLVVEDYYTEELRHQQVIDATQKANALEEKPVVSVFKQGILVEFPVSYASQIETGKVQVYRPSEVSKDLNYKLSLTPEGEFFVPAESLVKGYYELVLEWKMKGEVYQMKNPFEWEL